MEETFKKKAIKIQIWTFAWVIVFVISCVYFIFQQFNTLENSINNIEYKNIQFSKDLKEEKEKIKILENKSNKRDISLAKISTQLKAISTTLLEIRKKLFIN